MSKHLRDKRIIAIPTILINPQGINSFDREVDVLSFSMDIAILIVDTNKPTIKKIPPKISPVMCIRINITIQYIIY